MSINVSGGALDFVSGIDLTNFERDIARMRAGIRSLADEQKKQSQGIEDFAKRASAAAAGFLSISAATQFVSKMVEVRGAFQQIEVAFTTMLQSKDKADKLMAQAVQLAAITPFTLQQVASGAKQLLAYGFAAEDVTKELTSLGNIAAGVGSDLNAIVYLYGTLKASGRVTQIDINQFAGRGIPIYQALADTMKINIDQVRAYVSAGKIGFPQIEAAFKKLTGAGGQFFNLMQEQSKTLTGQLSNLSDALDRAFNSLGKENEGLFAGAIDSAIDLVNNYQKIIDIIKSLIVVYGAYRAAVLLNTVTVGGWSFAEGVNIQFLIAKEALVKRLAAAEAAGAITVAAYTAVIAALGIVVYSLAQQESAAEIAQNALNDAQKSGERASAAEDGTIQGLVKTIKDHTSSLADKQKAYADLEEETKGYLKNYTLEQIAAGEAAGAIALYEGHIRHLIETESEYASYKDLGKKIDELNDQGIKAVGTFDRLAQSLKNTFSPITQGLTISEWFKSLTDRKFADDLIAKQKAGDERQAQGLIIKANPDVQLKIDQAKTKEAAKKIKDDAIKIFNDLFADGAEKNFDQLLKIAPNKESLDKLQKSLTESFEALAPTDKNRDVLGAKIRQVAKVIADSYNTGIKDAAKQVNKQKEFLDQFGKIEAAALGKSLDQQGEELKKVQDKYAEQRKKATASGFAPTSGVFTRINNAERAETGGVKYEQDTKLLKIELDKQKELQIEYDNYVQKFGIDAAKNKYAGIIDLDRDYYTRLADEQKTLTKIAPEDLTGNQQERLKMVNDLLTEENKRIRAFNDAQLTDALSASETYNTRALKLHDDYLKQRAIIEKTADVVDRAGRLAALDAYYAEDQEALRAQNSQKIALLQHYSDNVVKLTKTEAEAQIKTLQDILSNNPDLERTQQFEIANQIANLRTALQSLNGFSDLYTKGLEDQKAKLEAQLKPLKVTDAAYKEIFDNLVKINKELSLTGKNPLVEPDQYGQKVVETTQSKRFKMIAAYADAAQSSFSQLSNDLKDINPNLADTLNTLSQLAGVAGNAAKSFSSFSSGDIVGGITNAISSIGGIFSIFGAAKKSAQEAAAKMQQYTDSLIISEVEYNNLLRDRIINQQDITDLTVQELEARQKLLDVQKQQAQQDYNDLLAKIQGNATQNAAIQAQIDKLKSVGGGILGTTGILNQLVATMTGGQYITGQHTEKHGGFFGIGAKTTVVQDTASTAGMTYDQLEELYVKGKLTDQTKAWFEELQKVKNQLDGIADSSAETAQQLKETLTGTTADSIEQSIIQGLKNGKRGISDFAGDFGDAMQNSLISVFEDQYLKKAVAGFYDQFAQLADGGLTPDEMEQLRSEYAGIINNASTAFDQITKLTGTITAPGQNLTNAITGITTDQADLIAGQFGGMRLAQLQGNQILINNGLFLQQIVSVGSERLAVLNKIETNTGLTAKNSDYLSLLKDVKDSLANIDKKTGSAAATAQANGLYPG